MNNPGTQTSIPGTAKRGRIRQYKNDAARVRAYRKRQKANLDTVYLRCQISAAAKTQLAVLAGKAGISERAMLESLIQMVDSADYS